ncbi:hypothetical protein GDO86_002815 [Hymenochirus boettgeri]|uniref:Uncharacterized protein n=1 Tax=Hymenochirus boettgeri TaxID=247094 RepID=A0A8T2K4I8_9PIPI|nr:hypothetical protein GDO86_002815 [Hymenochirus boettgeri]
MSATALQTASSIQYPRSCVQPTVIMLSLCFFSFILFACQVSRVQGGESDLYITNIYLYPSLSEASVLPQIIDYDTNTIKQHVSNITMLTVQYRLYTATYYKGKL